MTWGCTALFDDITAPGPETMLESWDGFQSLGFRGTGRGLRDSGLGYRDSGSGLWEEELGSRF